MSQGASLELSARCQRWGQVFEWSQGKQIRDLALDWVLLPVALRAAARRLPTSLHAADASPECVLSMTVPARSKTEAFKEGENSDLGLRISSEQGLQEAWDGRAAAARWDSIPVSAWCRSAAEHLQGLGFPLSPVPRPLCPSLGWGSAPRTLGTGSLPWKSLRPLRWLAGELAFLEILFSSLSFAFICLLPLRSAACQGRVTKGWVEKNDSSPI